MRLGKTLGGKVLGLAAILVAMHITGIAQEKDETNEKVNVPTAVKNALAKKGERLSSFSCSSQFKLVGRGCTSKVFPVLRQCRPL